MCDSNEHKELTVTGMSRQVPTPCSLQTNREALPTAHFGTKFMRHSRAPPPAALFCIPIHNIDYILSGKLH